MGECAGKPGQVPGETWLCSLASPLRQGANPSLPINVDARISLERPLIAGER